MTSTDNGKIRPAIYSMVVVLIVWVVLALLVFAELGCRESGRIKNDSSRISQEPNQIAQKNSNNVKPDPYFEKWGGWELTHLAKARERKELIFQSDFSTSGLEQDWKADGIIATPSAGAVVLSLSPEKAAGWGALWVKTPFSQPLMIEVEFTLDKDAPHDANLIWGQQTASKENLGKAQECYFASCFGFGGKTCGFERASDWYVYGVTGAADPKPGVKRTVIWIIDDKAQYLYLDEKLLIYSHSPASPPKTGHFGLGIYQSKVTYHSARIYRLLPKKK